MHAFLLYLNINAKLINYLTVDVIQIRWIFVKFTSEASGYKASLPTTTFKSISLREINQLKSIAKEIMK